MNERSSSRIVKPTALSNFDDDDDVVVVNEGGGLQRRQWDFGEEASSEKIAGVSSTSSTTEEMAEMILGKVSTTTSSIDNINNNDNLEQQKQPIVALATASFVPIRITNYIGGEIFESLICSRFLDSDDMISLLQINGIIKSFPQIRQRYCKIHGTKLDLTYEDYSERRHHHQQQQERNRDPDSDRDNNDGTMNTTTTTTNIADNNNDARFFSWWLEHQAFISADNNGEELPSISPDCIDCRMARFHHEKKCPCCKTFWNHEDIVTCAGQCQKTACADACHDGISQCACNKEDCHNDGMFCSDCFTGYFCEPCETMYDKKCMPPRVCDGDACGDLICNGCADEGQRYVPDKKKEGRKKNCIG
jgi:hypothetical protein